LSFDPKEYWNRRAREYGEAGQGWKAVCYIGDSDWANKYLNSLQEWAVFRTVTIKPGMKILDAGCGVGRWSLKFAQLGASVTGCDISEEMVRIAKERAAELSLNVDFRVQPIEELNKELENSFDLVISIGVLQHIVSQEKFLIACRKLVQMAKPDGKILLVEYVPRSLRTQHSTIPQMTCRTRKQVLEAFERAGGELVFERGVRFMKIDLYWRYVGRAVLRNLVGSNGSRSSIGVLEDFRRAGVGPRMATTVFNLIRRVVLMLQTPADKYLAGALTPLAFDRVLLFKKIDNCSFQR
jgi:2-polyprenyl-3-methyl-5-hydroxy-6-metoxy-1,4-benzoquinol methylase